MPYEVIGKEVVVLKSLSHDEKFGHWHESIPWVKGDTIPDEDISPVVVDQYKKAKDGEGIRALLKHVEAKKKGGRPAKTANNDAEDVVTEGG